MIRINWPRTVLLFSVMALFFSMLYFGKDAIDHSGEWTGAFAEFVSLFAGILLYPATQLHQYVFQSGYISLLAAVFLYAIITNQLISRYKKRKN